MKENFIEIKLLAFEICILHEVREITCNKIGWKIHCGKITQYILI